MPTFDDIKTMFANFVGKADNHYVETEQAVQAATIAMLEQIDETGAQMEYDDAVAAVVATAAALAGNPDLLEQLFTDVQVAMAAKGQYVIEKAEATAAIETAIREQAEADIATFDAQAAKDEITAAMNEFTL